ncbi:Gfo/Idh/MocA family oxidoreductase [Paraglaciecola aquimarina]|uniref:Gfo/Idh/MocA family oxidoreductase n=1 Tax=Paraglaciecola algarum TaxID=3050085 RepID=A0ABS9D6D8_9ALTE|nr:Gfo/Idh/MocA family oxidoreductase [Paraglaciecola sp. G1-23]MCF2948481.1 Gfo/Idh/MocA family oxidoreductase [Paraglaciecola sp. G1-23]
MKKNKNSSVKNSMPRREFIKNSSLFTGGLLMASSFLSPAYANKVKNDKKLKLAVIGCGGRGTGAVSQALIADKNVELVAMADAFEDRLTDSYNNLNEMFGGAQINVKPTHKFVGFGSYKKAIDEADVVILATPPGFRPQHFEYAVAQGKHVFMEKPVATDVAGIKKVMAATEVAKHKNLNVVVGLQRHYQRSYLEAYKRIKRGAIGDIVSGQVYWNSGGVWVRPRKDNMTEMEYQMRNWYYFNWLCGDHILEQHIHNIDVANWFIGEYPTTAQGMGGREVRNGKDHGQIFDHHFVEFTYPSGAVISSQCRHQPNCMNRVDEVFQGTEGSSYTKSNESELKSYKKGVIYKHQGEDDVNPYQQEHNRLFAAIRQEHEVINDADNGAKSTMTAILGRMATYTGKQVTWDEAMQSNLTLVPDEDSMTFDVKAPVMPDEQGNYPVPVPGKSKLA